MKFTDNKDYYSGVAIPVSSLISSSSCGIGEFSDLVTFADWAAERRLDFIQILPVNDTGFDPSPYSALSAYALHPVYLRLEDIAGARNFKKEINEIREQFNGLDRVPFYEVVRAKQQLFEKIYEANYATYDFAEVEAWVQNNPWAVPYAVFNHLKGKNGYRHWRDWEKSIKPVTDAIEKYFNECNKGCMYYLWLQYEAEKQLKAAASAVAEKGIFLKGDIPILMNEDSVDVWFHPEFFNKDERAGAPPDMFSDYGQHWGFPVYDWQSLRENDYIWWKERLKRADLFYHAYRIDHVLGFFRIWAIPESEVTGLPGYYSPYPYLKTDDLVEAGFDSGRIKWLSEPHIHLNEIKDVFSDKSDEVMHYLTRLGNEDLFLIRDDLRGEKYIYDSVKDEQIRDWLLAKHRDRCLLRVSDDEGGMYFPSWKYTETSSFNSLSDEEKGRLDSIINENGARAEKLWEENGRELLGVLRDTVDMLVCAEDLGAVPACVGPVLKDLNILGLKIERWTRCYDDEGQPFIDVKDYPYLSVNSTSVHDSSTLRGWWLEESDKDRYMQHLGHEIEHEGELSVESARLILENQFRAASKVTIIPLQDYFALAEETRLNTPDDERVNIPGTTYKTNWGYRLPFMLEDIVEFKEFNAEVDKLTAIRAE